MYCSMYNPNIWVHPRPILYFFHFGVQGHGSLIIICTCYLVGLGYTKHVQKRKAVPRETLEIQARERCAKTLKSELQSI